jgi:hypothetical protein
MLAVVWRGRRLVAANDPPRHINVCVLGNDVIVVVILTKDDTSIRATFPSTHAQSSVLPPCWCTRRPAAFLGAPEPTARSRLAVLSGSGVGRLWPVEHSVFGTARHAARPILSHWETVGWRGVQKGDS